MKSALFWKMIPTRVARVVLEMRSEIGSISKEIYQGAAATVEHALNVAIKEDIRKKALSGYLSMVRVATEAAGSKLEVRVKSVVAELETIVGAPISEGSSHSENPIGVSPTPAPPPSAVHYPAAIEGHDAVVARTPAPPPRPAHPPVAPSTGHDQISDDQPPTSPARAISDRSGALMADLNRMLAGPPKLPGRRGTIQSILSETEESGHANGDHQTEPGLRSPISPSSPRELAPVPEPQTLEGSEADASPPQPTKPATQEDLSGSVHSLSTSVDKPASAEVGKTALAETGKFAKGTDVKDGKEKKKFGLKSMLTHMTKGRPKAPKKKGSSEVEGSNDQVCVVPLLLKFMLNPHIACGARRVICSLAFGYSCHPLTNCFAHRSSSRSTSPSTGSEIGCFC
ncbi:hypothetical protein BJ742DRAFT_21437 [Cladochytrium replicatum]|nr:hypothetical protein BJ742DRAFT_21437 [Cladochytrium replicatum]